MPSAYDCLSTFLIVANANQALCTKTLRPPAAQLNIGLRKLAVGSQQPSAEANLGQHIKHGVEDDLGADARLVRAISDTPDAKSR